MSEKHNYPTRKIMATVKSNKDSLMILADFDSKTKTEEVQKVTPIYNELHEKMVKVAREFADAAGVNIRLKTIIILS